MCRRGDAPTAACEAFQPMSAERRERILTAVLGGERNSVPVVVAASPARSPSRRRAFVVGAGLALAAAVGLFVAFRSPEPLPLYALSIEGGATVRAAASGSPSADPP